MPPLVDLSVKLRDRVINIHEGLMRNSPRLMKVMSCILAFTTTAMPFHGIAQDPPKVNTHDFLSQLGRDGQQLGKELGNEAKNSPTKVENGKITVPMRGDDGVLEYDIDS